MKAGLIRETLAFAAAVLRFSGRRGLAAGFLVGFGAILEGFGIVLLVPLLAILFRDSAAGTAGPLVERIARLAPDFSPTARLALILVVFAVLMTSRALVLWRRDAILSELQVGFIEAQRVIIARALANASWRTLGGIGHGRITHLIAGDIQRCGAGVYFLLQGAAVTVILVAQIALAFLLSPVLALLGIGAMALGALALSGLLRRSHDAGKMVAEAGLALISGLGRFLGGMKVAMSQNLQHEFVAEFEREIGASVQRQASFGRQQAVLRALWSLLAAAVAATTMLIGFAALHISAPVLLALLVILARISGPASQLHLGFQQIAYSLSAWQAVSTMERMLAAAAVYVPAEDGCRPPLRGTIAFEHVIYRHEGNAKGGVLEVSLRIAEGEMIGLSGASGAGKTTLADLLVGLIEPQSGQIFVDNQLLTDTIAQHWRERIAYVAQDPVMFNESIRRNMIWSSPSATESDLRAALIIAGADKWVERLPNGLETIVGERGMLISGGERQRLALARALLRKPALLILDEATSAIDLAAEREIMTRLRRIEPPPTILMIAHRAESLRFCDRIIVLADGRLVADETSHSSNTGGHSIEAAVSRE